MWKKIMQEPLHVLKLSVRPDRHLLMALYRRAYIFMMYYVNQTKGHSIFTTKSSDLKILISNIGVGRFRILGGGGGGGAFNFHDQVF